MGEELKPRAIVVHCSDSAFGDARTINSWHEERGFAQTGGDGVTYHIGYHAVILNGIRKYGEPYDARSDGLIEAGRPPTMQGAHCKARGMNSKALGVCLVGHPDRFTRNQMDSLERVLTFWCLRYPITLHEIHGHNYYDPIHRAYDPGFGVENWLKERFGEFGRPLPEFRIFA